MPRIAALGHEVVISGPFSFAGSPMGWSGFNVLPGAQDPFGSDVIAGHYRRHGCDVLISLCDVFMMDAAALQGLNVVHWLPVDCRRMGKMDAEKAAAAGAVIAMSRFGQRQMEAAGFSPFYVPHGVDTTLFSPPEDRKALRVEMGFDPDDFLIGLNAANKAGPRKSLQEQVIAFAGFRGRHPESKLLIHSFAQPKDGLDIKALADYLGVSSSILLPDQYSYACGLMDTPTMARWYGILDVLLNASYGEGFGLPIIEAQACGVPVIVTDASTMPELCGAGWKVKGEDFWVSGHDAMWTRPSIPGIEGALEHAHAVYSGPVTTGDGETVSMGMLRDKAREFALQYDVDRVLDEFWKPVLEVIDEKRPQTRPATAEMRQGLPEPQAGDDRRDMLLVVPSRGRPDSVRRLIGAVAATSTARTDIVFGFDADDPATEEARSIVEAAAAEGKVRVSCVVEPDLHGLGNWTNVLAMGSAQAYRYLCSLGDDHEPQTPGWDTELIRVLDANGPGFAYPNDQVRNDIPQIVVVSSEIVQALGWMCEPTLQHYFVDNVWSDLGQYSGSIWYLGDVTVEHVHHLRHPGKVEHDATYKANETKFADDARAYEKWRAERSAGDIATVAKVREAARAELAAA